ncbi:MAG: lipocalin-like domain-containing protein [Legionella sp.]|nr:lipocalin-like domain-containing protein [Legionella sp.]
MTKGLREQLIGAWKLVSYEERPVDGSLPYYPLSENPMGIIMYTPDGFMSAQLSKPDRKPFTSGDWFKGTDDDYIQEASTYIAYTGPFHVDEENKTLSHSMFISLFPNWIGQTQLRIVKIEGNSLYLSTATPILSGGKLVNSHLRWVRASQ